ncbi:ABC transporter substrate-binding protein [Microbacteriaceae bacterium K1510]|nr:ABC transporter substrate-binding protein [Microbacteriaceae bacterium K1510]
MKGAKRLAISLAVAVMSVGAGISPVSTQNLPTISIGDLALPVTNPVIVQVMKDQRFDIKHGFTLEPKVFNSITAFYSGLATGEVVSLIAGTTMIGKLRLEGAQVKLAATVLQMSHIAIITADPTIKRFEDLKGKQLAADIGAQQYQEVAMYALSKGLTVRKDITVVPANFPLARSLLAAGRVDAAMLIEPAVTELLQSDPKLHSIFNGAEAWREMTGSYGWDLSLAVHENLIKRFPDGTQRLIAAMQDVAAYIGTNTDDVDRIATQKAKFKSGVVKDAVVHHRYEFEVRPAWQSERKTLLDMIKMAVDSKFLDKMPDDGIIYTP